MYIPDEEETEDDAKRRIEDDVKTYSQAAHEFLYYWVTKLAKTVVMQPTAGEAEHDVQLLVEDDEVDEPDGGLNTGGGGRTNVTVSNTLTRAYPSSFFGFHCFVLLT